MLHDNIRQLLSYTHVTQILAVDGLYRRTCVSLLLNSRGNDAASLLHGTAVGTNR